jgi:hypothetical protein
VPVPDPFPLWEINYCHIIHDNDKTINVYDKFTFFFTRDKKSTTMTTIQNGCVTFPFAEQRSIRTCLVTSGACKNPEDAHCELVCGVYIIQVNLPRSAPPRRGFSDWPNTHSRNLPGQVNHTNTD